MGKALQFYGRHSVTEERRILSYKVENINDAYRALRRFRQASGWFVVREGKTIITNQRIYNNKFVPSQPETFIDRLDKFMASWV